MSLLSLLFLGVTAFAQNDSVYWELMAIDKPPHFNDQENGLKSFIQNQIKYPEQAIDDGLEGTVIISFYIDTTGATTDHQIVKGIRKDLDAEALRVAKLIKFEKPAMQKGKPIKVKFTVPVEFKLPIKTETRKKDVKNNKKASELPGLFQ